MLAGGRATRFGRDKLIEPYRGIPLLHHALRRVAEVCGDVVVVLAPDVLQPPLPEDVSVRIARDVHEGEGPLHGVRAGLGLTSTDVALVAAGDMPELRTPVLVEVLRALEARRSDAVALQDGDRFRPLPCAVRTGPALEVSDALLRAGSRSLHELLDGLRASVLEEAIWVALDPERRTLLDVDEPSDVDR